MSTVTDGLTADGVDHERLAQLEAVVDRGKRVFLEVGAALREIRDSKMYRNSHKSFAAYVEERFELRKSYAYQLIESATVVESVRHGGQIETERQAREVVKTPEKHRQAVVDRANEMADDRGGMTAAVVREARDEVMGEIGRAEKLPASKPVSVINDMVDYVMGHSEPFHWNVIAERLFDAWEIHGRDDT